MSKQWRVKWVWSFLGLEEQAVTVRCLAWSCTCFLSSSLLEVGRWWLHITQKSAWCHRYLHWFWKMLSNSCFSQLWGFWRAGAGSKHTYTNLPMATLPLLVIPMDSASSDFDIPKQWPKQGNKYCIVLEPAVRLNYTDTCKSEQNLICAFYRSLPLPTPRFWITSKDNLFQNKKEN